MTEPTMNAMPTRSATSTAPAPRSRGRLVRTIAVGSLCLTTALGAAACGSEKPSDTMSPSSPAMEETMVPSDSMTDGSMDDGAMDDSTMMSTEDAMSDSTMSDDSMSDGSMSDDSTMMSTEDSMSDGK